MTTVTAVLIELKSINMLINKKRNVGFIYTMNCMPEIAEQFNYPAIIAPDIK